MSWLARSIAATLSSPRGEPDSDAEDSEPESFSAQRVAAPEEDSLPCGPNRDPEAEEPEQPNTPSRGVKDDISELTETLTRRLWGVASFLAPPPESSTPRAAAAVEGEDEQQKAKDADGDDDGEEEALAGIRSDLAEIGGRVRSGISMLQNNLAVAEISKIASSLLPFGEGDAEEGESVVGVTEEVVEFVRHISTRPETWLDFPLFISERYADDFELSDSQYMHALTIEHVVPSLPDLKVEICSTDMSEACFWKIYFVLLHSKLSKQDAELLSTQQILEAREELLQSLQAKNKQGSKGHGRETENMNASSPPAEEKVIEPSIVQDKADTSDISSFEEPTSDITPVEAENFPTSTTDVEIIDKSVIEEQLAVKNEVPVESKTQFATDEDEIDEWPDDDPVEEVGAPSNSNRNSLGREEDVSFSDLEDDDDNTRDGQQQAK
ncbi:hypothetical protein PR202_ga05633 [Eleusine coracana subsp. coracana]|uniref:BSD domain-containing protein n=1 Tax=Eleusine coracana subsp. coracana TaxID=191504 RepID=A0AAV5BV55_ELECO|nr:hypothetical protein QOZ80_5AG0367040 [Eleusine coracana subsp. coracana]GJM89037.1 hypothetical protein PR202_ga05179 [Eleusine coracana subsp. coracana]GJM89438.1 hypothetical protein PR202_ga05633 [Eleusine coracana subsp. coracana]